MEVLVSQCILFLARNATGHDFLPVHASIKGTFLKGVKLSGKVLLTYFITNLTHCQERKCSQIVLVFL